MNKHERFSDHPPAEVPSNVEAEQALLGALLINNEALDRVPFLEPKHFYERLHGRIFEVAAKMIGAGKAADPVTMKSYLPADSGVKLDGETDTAPMPRYLARLAAEAVTVAGARDYASAIVDMWIRREAIAAAQDVVHVAFDLPPDKDVLIELEPLEERLTELRAERVREENRLGMGARYLASMSAACARGEIEGVPICLDEIAEVISEPCFEAGNLYALLSSSGEGKTSLTLQIVAHALKRAHPVLFLSYDQSAEQCVRQMVAQEYGVDVPSQRAGRLNEREWGRAIDFANWIDAQPFEIIKCSEEGAPKLCGYARRFVKRFGGGKPPLVVVDHIQSITPPDPRADPGSKARDINKVLKAGAGQTKSAWLILNQRNSEGMKRDNPRPISADLYGGDPAKQAYDAILYLYRPEKFKKDKEATAASDADWKKIRRVFPDDCEGLAELGALKVRFGRSDIRREVRFEDRFTRYLTSREAGLGLEDWQ
ncbi:MAG TPA: DnaB-like helicase C-terminal domain-containing protein [Mesorhizobium sp.]|jgi:replicative DNA helicase|nr:DnaB-like helicase C-terminal domain-containing protein [Mesorhizobium sp.]